MVAHSDVEIVFRRAGLLKYVVESVQYLVTEANLVVSKQPERVTMEIMDCSHVSLVSLTLQYPSFDHFRIDWRKMGREVHLGVNLNYLAKVLNFAHEEDECRLSYNQGDPYVHISTMDRSRTNTVREFEMKCVQVHEETVGIPQYPPGSTRYEITLESEVFRKLCQNFCDVSETIDIAVHNLSDLRRGVSFSSTYSQELGGRQVFAGSTVNVERHGPLVDASLTLSFSTRFLVEFTKASDISEDVVLEMCGEFPLKVRYTDPKQGISLSFYLAPKIDEEIME
ncbi:hypothetical protein M9434_005824 [Picochlorum sp. BPE23]|nr:hypothetical protein M9434_005824 [Picochlorum sp. BPE23]